MSMQKKSIVVGSFMMFASLLFAVMFFGFSATEVQAQSTTLNMPCENAGPGFYYCEAQILPNPAGFTYNWQKISGGGTLTPGRDGNGNQIDVASFNCPGTPGNSTIRVTVTNGQTTLSKTTTLSCGSPF